MRAHAFCALCLVFCVFVCDCTCHVGVRVVPHHQYCLCLCVLHVHVVPVVWLCAHVCASACLLVCAEALVGSSQATGMRIAVCTTHLFVKLLLLCCVRMSVPVCFCNLLL